MQNKVIKSFLTFIIVFLFIFILNTSSQEYNYSAKSTRKKINKEVVINLVKNGSFEKLNEKNQPIGWNVGFRNGGNVEVTTNDPADGKNSVHLTSTSPSSVTYISYKRTEIPENSYLSFSLKAKIKNVVRGVSSWYVARGTIYFYDKNNKKITHNDTFSSKGTNLNWFTVDRGFRKLAANVKYFDLVFQITKTSGEVFIDDVKVLVKTAQNPYKRFKAILAKKDILYPLITPTPRQITFQKEKLFFNKIAVFTTPEADSRVIKELSSALSKRDIISSEITSVNNISKDKDTLNILLVKSKNASILKRYFNANILKKLKGANTDQGYVLEAGMQNGSKVVVISAHTSVGIFYGIQSLKQMFIQGSKKQFIYKTQVIDYPYFKYRGAISGVQWFAKRVEFADRMAKLKGNKALFVGSMMGKKLFKEWRQPFNAKEINILKKHADYCRSKFIDYILEIGPGRYKTSIVYSSKSDFKILTNKIDQIYEVGATNILLAFDDLSHTGNDILVHKKDIKKYNNDIGKAHYDLTMRLYNYCRKKNPKTTFYFLPLHYSLNRLHGKRVSKYFKSVKKLPKEITFIMSGAGIDKEKVDFFQNLASRKPFVWDNYFAALWEKTVSKENIPVFSEPLRGHSNKLFNLIKGYTFLPNTPVLDDHTLLSWTSAHDFSWNTKAYSPSQAHFKNLYFYLGRKPFIFLMKIVKYNATLSDARIKIAEKKFMKKFPLVKERVAHALFKKMSLFYNKK